MSSSTSAKSADRHAAAPNEADTSVESKAGDGEDNAAATSDKDEFERNGHSEDGVTQDSENSTEPVETAPADSAAASEAGQGPDGVSEAGGSDREESGATQQARREGPEEDNAASDTEKSAAPPETGKTEAAPDGNESPEDKSADENERPEPEEQEDTLDLRALFASSEPDFGSPTDTFELARGAKPSAGKSHERDLGNRGSDPDADEPSPDLPPLDISADEGLAFMARGESASDASISSEGSAASQYGSFETDAQGDPLADAVQSALRSVYGDDSDNPEGDFRNSGDPDAIDGPVLQWAGADAAGSPDAGSLDESNPFEPVSDGNVFTSTQPDNAIDEETTEAVLSYLYEHMGSDDAGQASKQAEAHDTGHDEGSYRKREEDPGDRNEWRDSGMAAAHSGSAKPSATTNYDGYLSDRGDAAAYTASERNDVALSGVAPRGETGDFSVPMDLSLDNSEASGKLLGAAGLGLIGGIAVAGVAAVFVFNSFVTQQDPTASAPRTQARLSDSAPSSAAPETVAALSADAQKDDSRLGAPEQNDVRANAYSRTAATGLSEQTAGEAADATQRELAAPASAQPQISASDVNGSADQAIPLDLAVSQSDEESFVRLAGLPAGVKLSAGVDTGNGSWLLSTGRANDLSLSVPDTYSGGFMLEAQVLASDARTPVSEKVLFQVSVSGAAAETSEPVRTTAINPEPSRVEAEQAPSLIDRARSLMSSGDVLAARELLRPEAQDGDARAALALGRTFDPMTFNPDGPANAGPDATEAFRWYQKAVELGAPEGDKRIADLKSWLLQ